MCLFCFFFFVILYVCFYCLGSDRWVCFGVLTLRVFLVTRKKKNRLYPNRIGSEHSEKLPPKKQNKEENERQMLLPKWRKYYRRTTQNSWCLVTMKRKNTQNFLSDCASCKFYIRFLYSVEVLGADEQIAGFWCDRSKYVKWGRAFFFLLFSLYQYVEFQYVCVQCFVEICLLLPLIVAGFGCLLILLYKRRFTSFDTCAVLFIFSFCYNNNYFFLNFLSSSSSFICIAFSVLFYHRSDWD